jgi:hypothetical protein
MTANITQIPAPRVPLIDPDTGLISREWFRFHNSVYEQLGGGVGGATGTFKSADTIPKTITVVNGIITGIV